MNQFIDTTAVSPSKKADSVRPSHVYDIQTVLCREQIILMLMISGNVHITSGPGLDYPAPHHALSSLSFDEFCSRKSLGFLHLNIQSLLPKLDLVKAWIHTSNPNVLVLSETWLRKSVSNTEVHVNGFNIFRQDRSSGGGVIM